MTPKEKTKYVKTILAFQNIELCDELLEKVIKTIELVDTKKGNITMLDMAKLRANQNEKH